jgi:hypothetical protein
VQSSVGLAETVVAVAQRSGYPVILAC